MIFKTKEVQIKFVIHMRSHGRPTPIMHLLFRVQCEFVAFSHRAMLFVIVIART